MDKLKIEGGARLQGEVEISGAKNGALPLMAATLLAPGVHRLRRIPRLRDVEFFCTILQHLGAECARPPAEPDTLILDTRGVQGLEAPYDLVRKMRASVLVLGPLLARFGRARVSLPGGCAIGARPIELHLKGLRAMGAEVELREGYVEATAPRLQGASYYFDIPTVTGTENLMMAAALARGTTRLENAAREPEIVALGRMLRAMGAGIHGLGGETVVIEGRPELRPVEFENIPDRIETGTYMAAAAITAGDLLLKGADPDILDAVVVKLRETGCEIAREPEGIRVRGPERPESADLTTLPYPGFPTDLQAQFMALMTVARGASVITETIFENRFMHVAELRRLGADIRIDGRSAVVKGVEQLQGAPLMATDLRASASLVLAGLRAQGTTVVHRVYHLDRGYERMEEKLRRVGASIERLRG